MGEFISARSPSNGRSTSEVTVTRSAKHCVNDLISIFNSTFLKTENTQLVKGEGEPIYLPSNEKSQFSQVVFAHGFFSSALHEVAHWCVAGTERRELVDYGYWYEPDGRNLEQQKEFERVEIMPQALEWIFAVSCDKRFSVSVDNLSGAESDSRPFKMAVYGKVMSLCESGLSGRAASFHEHLADFYQTPRNLSSDLFLFSSL
ncbi:MAG: elongation factor P hydroxylase [Oceanicoccus sp.]|jgi:elongation factor P hydroxylase